MLREPKIVYLCDHKIVKSKTDNMLSDIIKSDGDYDAITQNGIIDKILSVYKLGDIDTSDEVKMYYEDIDFEVTDDKKNIKWISLDRPNYLDVFYIEYLNFNRTYEQYEQEDCPQCNTNGWYVSLVTLNKNIVNDIKSVSKLVQEFLKLLLTQKIDTYGSNLYNIVSQDLSDEANITSDVILAVKDVENQLKKYQNSDISLKMNMDLSEILRYAEVQDLSIEDGGIYVSILLKSEDDSIEGSTIGILI